MLTKKIRRLAAFSAIFLPIVAAAACSSSSGSNSAGGTVTIRFASQNTSQPAFSLLVKEFEAAHPNIKVQAQYVESTQYNTQISTQLAAGSAPDVFIAFPGTGTLPAVQVMAKAGYLADLSSLGFGSQLPSLLKPEITDGNKVYAWPIGESDYFMIYNKELFAKLHLSIPTTYAQLAQICTVAKAAGKTAIEYGGGGIPTNGVVALSLATATVYAQQPDWTAERTAGSVKFTDNAGWEAALQEIVNLKNDGCFNQGAAGTTTQDQFAQLTSGAALMTFGHSQYVGLANAATTATSPFKLGVFPFPAQTAADRRIPVAYPTQLVVNAKSQQLAAAEEFIKFATEPTVADQIAAANGFISLSDIAAGKRPAYETPILSMLNDSSDTVPFPLFAWPVPTVFVTLSSDVQGLLTGQTTVGSTLTDLDKGWPSS